MNHFNIEFAHIYADQKFSREHIKSLSLSKKIVEELNHKKRSFVTTILIDDYNPVVETLNENDFLGKIKEQEIYPDFLAYESKLSEIADELIKVFPKRLLKKQRFKDKEVLLLEIENKVVGLKNGVRKHTCSLLIAAWILTRFGVYEFPSLKRFSGKEFKADQLITILPDKYKETEERVLRLLAATPHKHFLNKMRYEFF